MNPDPQTLIFFDNALMENMLGDIFPRMLPIAIILACFGEVQLTSWPDKYSQVIGESASPKFFGPVASGFVAQYNFNVI